MGSFTFLGFFIRGIIDSFHTLFSNAKVQIKTEIKEQTRNKNVPKKS